VKPIATGHPIGVFPYIRYAADTLRAQRTHELGWPKNDHFRQCASSLCS
jgi:hypothetical protein